MCDGKRRSKWDERRRKSGTANCTTYEDALPSTKRWHALLVNVRERLKYLISPDPKRAAACREWHAWADQKGIGFATWSNEENRVRKTGEKPRCPKEKRFKEEGG